MKRKQPRLEATSSDTDKFPLSTDTHGAVHIYLTWGHAAWGVVFVSPPKSFLIFQGGPFCEWWSSEVATRPVTRADGCARNSDRLQHRKEEAPPYPQIHTSGLGGLYFYRRAAVIISFILRQIKRDANSSYLQISPIQKSGNLGKRKREVWFSLTSSINWWKNVLLGIPETMTKSTYSLPTRPPKRRNWFHITFHTSFILPPPEKGPHTMTQKTSVLFTAHLLVSLCPVELQESKPVWEPGGLRLFNEACPVDAGTVNHAWQTIVVRRAFVLFCFFWSGVGFSLGWLCSPEARVGVGGLGEGHGRHVHYSVGGGTHWHRAHRMTKCLEWSHSLFCFPFWLSSGSRYANEFGISFSVTQ